MGGEAEPPPPFCYYCVWELSVIGTTVMALMTQGTMSHCTVCTDPP